MYNGIGLQTARGSGTNGYVQRNLSFIKRHKDKVEYTTDEQLKKLDSQFKGPNPEILLHEKKRKIEVKCLEMEELMEEQGYTKEEIAAKLDRYRKLLTENSDKTDNSIELDESGRPIAKATHQLAEASSARNELLKQAFGISEFFKEGSSLDKDKKEKEKAAMELAQRKYNLVNNESSDEEKEQKEKSKNKSKKKDKKKKHKAPTPSSSSEDEDEKERNRKKKREMRDRSPVEKRRKGRRD